MVNAPFVVRNLALKLSGALVFKIELSGINCPNNATVKKYNSKDVMDFFIKISVLMNEMSNAELQDRQLQKIVTLRGQLILQT